MPHLMSLEGPPVVSPGGFRVAAAMNTPAQHSFAGLGATVIDTFKAHPLVLLAGIAAGLWYGAKKR